MTALTNAVILFLLAPSFQEGNGSVVARAAVVKRKNSRQEHTEIARSVSWDIFISMVKVDGFERMTGRLFLYNNIRSSS